MYFILKNSEKNITFKDLSVSQEKLICSQKKKKTAYFNMIIVF